MPNVLFVCHANRYRSPIAATCFRAILSRLDLGGASWRVSSAGTWTRDGLPAMPDAIEKAARLGLDIRNHHSRVITADLVAKADLILVMEMGQKEALSVEFPRKKAVIYLLSEAVKGISYDIPDPVLDPNSGDIASEICTLIKDGYLNILKLATPAG